MDKDRIASRRVYLRALTKDDAPALLEAVETSRESLKRRLRWVGDANDLEYFRRFIAAADASSDSDTWGVFEAKGDRLIGVASLQEMEDPQRGRGRLALWIASDRQDKGIGTEAARCLVDYGIRKRGLHRLFARLDPANRSFRRVLKKIGFRYEGCLRSDRRLNGRWVDQECWGMLKSELKR
ncbi:MAG: hypothetical protein AUJ52_15745 [Elusimicrobia bacterium CG1_02_63_36]|nr:MAG: hypothetical protein AUJ52_15745 [Elusimicrobia bacterium CG1_02_63_36]PIP81472.1 MAG: hypothetical protein COR54_20255 [Elusimicrobia bacterium CG22_combo_CG10-13_8_21_14_all_63_91]PJA17029.1 MAG: hypothetical protein COX66_05860 [Elusimicrobia bacterium CG_4_10_14_0_2_um_filter_63_34]PJB25753.1 MAG: hypothetical protein CO113_07115 [Elusimicrobia bacterium CG_4_9_14_3_um_filter_62_55]